GQRQQHHWHDLHQPDESERERVAGALIQFPADADADHHFAELGDEPPADQQAKITKSQRGIRIARRDRRFCCFWHDVVDCPELIWLSGSMYALIMLLEAVSGNSPSQANLIYKICKK